MTKTPKLGAMVAWAVLKQPKGYVAFRVEVDEQDKLTRHPLCEPCGESLAYTYLQARIGEHLVKCMVAHASTGR